jgi:hypothetical protein
MAMFLAEISFLLEVALFAAGLVLWHKGREGAVGLVRAAGVVLVVGASLTALCTGYFSIRYHVQGEFDHAYYTHPALAASAMMACGGARGGPRGMGPGGMGPGAMGPGRMRPGMMGQGMTGSGMMGSGMMERGGPPGSGPATSAPEEHPSETGD